MMSAAPRYATAEYSFDHRPPTGLICLENSHNAAGGAIAGLDQTAAVVDVARRHGVPIHLDGARLLNVAVALGVDARALAAGVDTVALNLNKGLCAPLGALLCGSTDFVARSRINWRRLGSSGIHQAASSQRPA